METHPLIKLEIDGIKLGIQAAKKITLCGNDNSAITAAANDLQKSLGTMTSGLSEFEDIAFRNGVNRGFKIQIENPTEDIGIQINNILIERTSA